MFFVGVALLVNGALVAGLALAFWNRHRAGPRQRWRRGVGPFEQASDREVRSSDESWTTTSQTP